MNQHSTFDERAPLCCNLHLHTLTVVFPPVHSWFLVFAGTPRTPLHPYLLGLLFSSTFIINKEMLFVICQPPSRFFSCYYLSYRVQGSHCSTGTDRSAVLLPSTLLPSSAGRGRGLYGLPHLCTSAYRALTADRSAAAQHTAAFCWAGSWTTGYLISVRGTYVCLPPHLSLRLNFQRHSVHSLVLRR